MGKRYARIDIQFISGCDFTAKHPWNSTLFWEPGASFCAVTVTTKMLENFVGPFADFLVGGMIFCCFVCFLFPFGASAFTKAVFVVFAPFVPGIVSLVFLLVLLFSFLLLLLAFMFVVVLLLFMFFVCVVAVFATLGLLMLFFFDHLLLLLH